MNSCRHSSLPTRPLSCRRHLADAFSRRALQRKRCLAVVSDTKRRCQVPHPLSELLIKPVTTSRIARRTYFRARLVGASKAESKAPIAAAQASAVKGCALVYLMTESRGVIALSSAGESVLRMLSTRSATESSAADVAVLVASTALLAAPAALSTTLSFSKAWGM